jgi:hypothetical protein
MRGAAKASGRQTRSGSAAHKGGRGWGKGLEAGGRML